MPVRVALPDGRTLDRRRSKSLFFIPSANVWMALMMESSSGLLDVDIALSHEISVETSRTWVEDVESSLVLSAQRV